MKNSLLVILASLFVTFNLVGQVPANNLIGDALLINSFPFTDSDIRLDLATASAISPSGCPAGNYKLVYYKFTAAATSSQFDVVIHDASDGEIGSSFVIFFSAPSLNVMDETELTILSSCTFSSSTSINLVQDTNYYVLVHRSMPDALSNIVFEEALPVATTERDALIALYNSTNGDSWSNNTNWNSAEPVGTWYGIKTKNVGGVGYVSEINLGNNNLTGSIPVEIGNFPEMTYLGLWANQLTGNIPAEIGNLTNLVHLDITPNNFSGTIPEEIGNLTNLEVLWLNNCGLSGSIPLSFQNLVNLRELYLMGSVPEDSVWSSSKYSGDFPDLTALPLELLQIENNFFQFSDIADEFDTYQNNIINFVSNPQYTVDPPEEVSSDVGEDIILTLTDDPGTVGGRIDMNQGNNLLTGNTYQWFKDDVLIDGANSSSYTIVNAQTSDTGIYFCEITNPDVSGFVVRRSDITVNVGTLNLNEANTEISTLYYPNPTKDLLNITLNEVSEAHVSLFDVTGKLLYANYFNSNKIVVPMGHLDCGVYLLKMLVKGNVETKSIIKY